MASTPPTGNLCSDCGRETNRPPDLVCTGWPGAPYVLPDGSQGRQETAVPMAHCPRLAALVKEQEPEPQPLWNDWRESRQHPEKRVRRRA